MRDCDAGNYSQMWNFVSHKSLRYLQLLKKSYFSSIFLALFFPLNLLRYLRTSVPHTRYGLFNLVVGKLPSGVEKRSEIESSRLISIISKEYRMIEKKRVMGGKG